MLESLTEKITAVLKRLEGRARLTEEIVNEALREVRLALLEADVNFKVVKTFVSTVKERCLTAEVLEALTPSQQVLAIVHEELTNILGAESHGLESTDTPPPSWPSSCGATAKLPYWSPPTSNVPPPSTSSSPSASS